MKEGTVNTGSIFWKWEWKKAIKTSVNTSDTKIISIYKDKYPNKLLSEEKIFNGYQIVSQDNHRTYKTRIPRRYDEFTKNILIEKEKQVNK